MTLHVSDAAVIADAKQIAKKKSRKYIFVGVGVAALLASTAAYAEVRLHGYGTFNSEPAMMKNLDISGSKLVGPLVPGTSVAGQASVTNSNDYAVTVIALILNDASLVVKGERCGSQDLVFGGERIDYPGTAGEYPGSGTPAHKVDLQPWVTIPAGQTRTVTAPGVLSQKQTAIGFCGVKVDFAVRAQVGSQLH